MNKIKTDREVMNISLPEGKSSDRVKVSDRLYLRLRRKNGSLYKNWVIPYKRDGKQKEYGLGSYNPKKSTHVSLKEAKQKSLRVIADLNDGIDVSIQKAKFKEAERQEAIKSDLISFEHVAQEWYSKKLPAWADSTARHNKSRLSNYINPRIGKQDIKEIKPFDVLAIARIAENKGYNELAHRIVRLAGQVMRYGVACGYVESDCTRDLAGALAPVKTKHHPCLKDPKSIGELMRRIHAYDGTFVVRCALKLTPYLFLRPGELRKLQWSWVDFERRRITIPVEVMKMRNPHFVHISRQALAILEDVYGLTGDGKYIFAGQGRAACLSDGTVNKCLRAMGYNTQNEQDAHGFRGLATTQLYEQGINPQYIELQLAHAYGTSVSKAYNHSQVIPERAKMLDNWADYLDGLRDGANVVSINRYLTSL